MPTSFRPSTTGNPENLYFCVMAITSRTDMVGGIVIGSLTTPLSKRFTLATSAACLAGGIFLCTKPKPPSWAMAMAKRLSVTVSIAADSSGMFSAIREVRRVWRLTSRGTTEEWAGRSRTSSKVSAFWTTRMVHFSYAQKRIIRGLPHLVNVSHCLIRNLSEIDSLPHLRNLSEIAPSQRRRGRDGADDEGAQSRNGGDGGAVSPGEQEAERTGAR